MTERSALGWRWLANPSHQEEAATICQHFAVPPLVGQLLASRGLKSEQVAPYLSAKLPSPRPDRFEDMAQIGQKLADCSRLGDLLCQSIRKRSLVTLFADYDVDGAASAAILDRWLTDLGCPTEVVISCRTDGGYGPTAEALDRIRSSQPSLTVLLDCGTASADLLNPHQSQGFQTAVIDHHQVPASSPQIAALLNPYRADDGSGLVDICTAGLVYIVIAAIQQQMVSQGWLKAEQQPQLSWLLDMVALATVCDMMPLHGLNRSFVKAGLQIFAARKNVGLTALVDRVAAGKRVDAAALAFQIGPCINAAGRIGDSSLGHRLLMTRYPEQAAILATQLQENNQARRMMQNQALDQALAMLNGWNLGHDDKRHCTSQQTIWLTSRLAYLRCDEWHPGVVGLVASKISEMLPIPILAAGRFGDSSSLLNTNPNIFGSARSASNINIGQGLQALESQGLILAGGGHSAAGGFSLRAEQEKPALAQLETILEQQALAERRPFHFDLQIASFDLKLANAYHLRKLEPLGYGFPPPVFLLANLELVDCQGDRHLKLQFQASRTQKPLYIIAFSPLPPLKNALQVGQRYDLLLMMSVNTWRGRDSLQLILKDVRVCR